MQHYTTTGQRRKENMAKTKTKNFRVPSSLYRELESAAKQKGRTLTQYMDDLFGALMCGEVVEHGN
jgi:predicted DNA-binding protein